MDYVCECGNTSKISLSNFKKGKRCNKCGDLQRSESQSLDPEYVYKNIESRGYIILDKNFQNVNTKLSLKCNNGHVLQASFRSLKGNNYNCFYCSRESKRGENHHNYIHGLSREHRIDRNISRVFHNEWKRALLRNFNYKCCICDGNVKLSAHHLNGYNWDIDNRYNVENGVILCKHHHDKFHKIYGKGNNTIEQFNEYKSKELI